MKKFLNKIITISYGLVVFFLTMFVGLWLVGCLYGVVQIMLNAWLHIVDKHNFQFGDRLKSRVLNNLLTYEYIKVVFIWRLTLDVGTMFRIATRYKIKWYQLLEDNNFVKGIMSHFFVGIPEAPDLEKLPFPSKGSD